MPVALPDILSCDGRSVYMRAQAFDLEGVRRHIAPVKLRCLGAAASARQSRGPGGRRPPVLPLGLPRRLLVLALLLDVRQGRGRQLRRLVPARGTSPPAAGCWSSTTPASTASTASRSTSATPRSQQYYLYGARPRGPRRGDPAGAARPRRGSAPPRPAATGFPPTGPRGRSSPWRRKAPWATTGRWAIRPFRPGPWCWPARRCSWPVRRTWSTRKRPSASRTTRRSGPSWRPGRRTAGPPRRAAPGDWRPADGKQLAAYELGAMPDLRRHGRRQRPVLAAAQWFTPSGIPWTLIRPPRPASTTPFVTPAASSRGIFSRGWGDSPRALDLVGISSYCLGPFSPGKVANINHYAYFRRIREKLPYYIRGNRHGQPCAQGSRFSD